MAEERLQKYISGCGVTSRRKAEEMILNGYVKVNGNIVEALGTKIDPENDIVSVNDQIIIRSDKKLYLKLHKPEGYVTTMKDQFGRKCVVDLIDINDRVYPIGRLDYDTSGLLLLTNDGDLANRLMHPRYNINKTYVADIDGVMTETAAEKLRTGIAVEDYVSAPATVKILKTSNASSVVQISIHEGKNRQVRKMFASAGYNVVNLKRISVGDISLDNLNPGQWKYLSKEEIDYLKK